MEKGKRGFLKNIDPRNFNFAYKILLLTLGVVLLILLIYFILGLKTLHRSLLTNTLDQLEELVTSKTSEVELYFQNIKTECRDFALDENTQMAAVELISAFQSLKDDKYELFIGGELSKISTKLEEFYSETAAQNLPLTGDKVMELMPVDPMTIVSQYLYLANPVSNDDYSSFSSAVRNYHANFSEYLKSLNANDILVVDPKSGYVVFSVKKNIDFGTNLFEGPLSESKLSTAFRKALASGKPDVIYIDFSVYAPASDQPVAFLSVPVYSFNELIYVIIVQYGSSLFDEILAQEIMMAGESTFEYTLVGRDLGLHNNPKKFLFNEEHYIRSQIRMANRSEAERILRYKKIHNMTILAQYPIDSKNIILMEKSGHLVDYSGNSVLASSKKLTLNKDDELFLVAKTDRREALKPFRRQLRLEIILALALIYVTFLVVRAFGRSFTKRLKALLDGIVMLYNGEKVTDLEDKSNDELGDTVEAYNKLRRRINSAEEFALEMSDGNYNYNFKQLSERDSLGKSLNVLKDTLIKSRDEHEARSREDEIRNWINDGVAKFNDLLRENNSDIKLLAYSLIENLITYLNASVGGVFLVEGEREDNKHIELVAGYAYDRRKYHEKSVEIGEGLLGACYLEKKSIYLKQVPDDYIEITSGLGHEIPRCLYIVPLKVDEAVMGMIEVASFDEFTKHQLEFIDRVADSIAATFVSVRLNMKTTVLLEESNRKAEEIAQQEEEMRQNLEEMQATQDELARLRQDDEKRTREMQLVIDNSRRMLKSMLDAIPGGFILKDQNGIIHLANIEGAGYYNLSPDRVIGKTDHELVGSRIHQTEHKKDMEVLEQGEKEYTEEHDIKGKIQKYRVIKKPFEIAEIGQTGILTMRYKIG